MVDLGEPAPVMKNEIDEAFKRIEERNREIKLLRHQLRDLLAANDEDISVIKKECAS